MINGNIHKVLIGSSLAAFVSLLSFMGYGIVGNEVRNVADHKEIRYEASEKIDNVKDIVTDIRIEQSEQRILLQGIAEKM